MTRKVYFSALIAGFLVLWAALAISPHNRSDWLLENALLLAGVIVLIATRKILPLSGVSYTTILLFLCLHTIGAHYTYAEVPYDAAFKSLTGHSFNEMIGWQRNNYDRIVHFSYGLLLAYPIRELFLRVANVRGFWGYFLPLDLTMSSSMVYELSSGCRQSGLAAILAPHSWAHRAMSGTRRRTWRWPRSAGSSP